MPSKSGIAYPPSQRPKPAPSRWTASRRRWVAIAAATIVVLFLAGLVGWSLNGSPSRGQVTVSDTFTGKVTILNHGPGGGCVQPDSGGRALCSTFAVIQGESAPRVGDRVKVARETVWTGDGDGYEIFVIYPEQAP